MSRQRGSGWSARSKIMPRRSAQPSADGVEEKRFVIRRRERHRIAAIVRILGGHARELGNARLLDAELGEGVGNAELAAQLHHPVEQGNEGALDEAEIARDAGGLLLDRRPV